MIMEKETKRVYSQEFMIFKCVFKSVYLNSDFDLNSASGISES